MNNDFWESHADNSESGRDDGGQTTGTVTTLGLSPATHFSLQSLPRPGSVMLPEQSQEVEEKLQDERERTDEERTGAPPWGG